MPKSLPSLISGLVSSIDRTVSLSESSFSAAESSSVSDPLTLALPHFSSFAARLKPIILHLHQSTDPGVLPIKEAVESLDSQLNLAHALISDRNASPVPIQSVEDCVHDLGRCLGLLLVAWADAPGEIREGMVSLQKEMIRVRLKGTSGPEIIGVGDRHGVVPDLEDVVVRVKRGDETGVALMELGLLIRRGLVGEEESLGVISVLSNRLGSARCGERLKIILLLRVLAGHDEENKERMAGIEALSAVVRSMTRDEDESREAVGLLLELCSIPKVRQRIGRVQGCIVMLVTLFNGGDPRASHDAGKLLVSLSSNSQNVLLMAEAGHFAPLVQYLKEGSDMNKILMATAISRMELTDQMRATLGERGCIEPIVTMFTSGKLEAKMAALGALRNLTSLAGNVERAIHAGVVSPLIQLMFSVTSVLLTLREPASAILASLARSELILAQGDAAQQILSLLSLSSPAIQLHLLQALNSIAGHQKAKRIRARMKENGAMQLLLPFLIDNSTGLRTVALGLLFHLSGDFTGELTDLLEEKDLNILVGIVCTAASEDERAAAVAILSNIPTKDKKSTDILARANLLPILVSLLAGGATAACPARARLVESAAGVLVRFTVPWDKKLQRMAAAHGVIPCLVKLLSDGSAIAKARAATSLSQLSQNTPPSSKAKPESRWRCAMRSSESWCELHGGRCVVKNTFCLVKAGAVSPLLRVLEGKERDADEAALGALATLMADETWEKGSEVVEKAAGVLAVVRILDVGSLKAQERAIWMLERIFRLEMYREKYGAVAQVVLIDLAQKGDASLKPTTAMILAHLQLLQMQSSYF